MATDPICGMMVDETSALRAERNGQTFYFCSEHCRQKFLQIPTSGVRLPSSGHSHMHHGEAGVKPSTTAKYFCPMCAGVESDRPGDCPKCGMALDRKPVWLPP